MPAASPSQGCSAISKCEAIDLAPSDLAVRDRLAAPRFLVADDHRFVCEALAHLIRHRWPEAQVCQADSFTQAMTLLAKSEFDVAILDFCMPGSHGSAAIEAIHRLHPATKLVIISGAIEPAEAMHALAEGVVAYVPKSVAGDSIVQVLTLVLEGETYVPRALVEAVARGAAVEGASSCGRGLDARDARLLEALIKGQPNKVIAHALGVSESTVKLHMHKLFQKLGVHNRTEAVARGLNRLKPRP